MNTLARLPDIPPAPDTPDLTAQLYAIIGAQAAVLEMSYRIGYADGAAAVAGR